MYNCQPQGSTANILALHYLTPDKVDSKSWFAYVEKWMKGYDIHPTKMSGKGFKNITYARGKKWLEKEEFKPFETQGFWIAALPPKDQIQTEGFDYLMSASMGCEQKIYDNFCAFCWDNDIEPWQISKIIDLVKDLYGILCPHYGYALQRSFEKGPGSYPIGSISGLRHEEPDERQEEKEITNWGNIGLDFTHPLYKPHMIRDIYPLNFLSPQHLGAKIGSQTLQQWIQDSPSRGTLEEIVPDFWCWSVEAENSEAVKDALKPHNLLIAHMPY